MFKKKNIIEYVENKSILNHLDDVKVGDTICNIPKSVKLYVNNLTHWMYRDKVDKTYVVNKGDKEILFISRNTFELPWGTANPLVFQNSETGDYYNVKGHGYLDFIVGDNTKFRNNFYKHIRNEHRIFNQIEEVFRSVFNEVMIKNNDSNPIDVFSNKKKIVKLLLDELNEELKKFGVFAKDVRILHLGTPLADVLVKKTIIKHRRD